jgi:hypothetical protein
LFYLVIQDNNGNIVWQSNIAANKESRYRLELDDSGCISLINAEGLIIWSSRFQLTQTTTAPPTTGNL